MIPNPSSTQYDWPFYAAQHLSGEPDCTFLKAGGYTIEDLVCPEQFNSGNQDWMLEGMFNRMYGPMNLNVDCN
jgi:hypothetical protein